ncbi:MAG: GHKL domain-containing protein [Oscillospiraceae bacterium]|nr:GHKL domain-containing protein [Oscillospiraceae bacterium]
MDDIIDRDRKFIVLSIIGLAVMNLVTYYLVVNLSAKNIAVKENELLKFQQAYEQQYISNAKLEYETIMKLKHDFKNNYAVIYALLLDNNTEKALHHIEQNIDRINSINSYIETNNDIVNAIINIKVTLAKTLGIQVSCLSVSDFSGIDDSDLCDLLSNMFENAITACVKMKNENVRKQIYLKISSNDLRYTFSMKNTVFDSVFTSNPDLMTTKSDKENHGYGTKIIRSVATKYDGQCDFYEEDNFFCCTVTLSKK